MRAYRLHSSSWARIVTLRVRRPEAIAERLKTRRRADEQIPKDGQLVLLNCNHVVDPRTGATVTRRELLDRVIEALSIAEVDGVIASADLLEELTLLNVLEHRLAFCASPGEQPAGVLSTSLVENCFDGAMLTQQWHGSALDGAAQTAGVATDAAELAMLDLPAIVDLAVTDPQGRTEFDTSWSDWIEPLHETSAVLATGAGVWISVPAVSGLSHLAEATGFPMLVRDTDVPIDSKAWELFFESELPITIRGMVAGVSALFPLGGSVAEATANIARSVRNRVSKPAAA